MGHLRVFEKLPGYAVSEPRVEIVLWPDPAQRAVGGERELEEWCDTQRIWCWVDPRLSSVWVRAEDAPRVVAWLEGRGFTRAKEE